MSHSDGFLATVVELNKVLILDYGIMDIIKPYPVKFEKMYFYKTWF